PLILRRSWPMLMRNLLFLGLFPGVWLGVICLSPAPVSVAQQPEKPWFRDATKEYGPIGGGSPAFADLDGDGYPDLICDGRIYRNDRGKRFVDVTKESGVAGSGTATVADFDNDGLLDIYFSGGKGA